MTDQEILDKYIDLGKVCLTEKEKKEIMEMLYKYKKAFIWEMRLEDVPT